MSGIERRRTLRIACDLPAVWRRRPGDVEARVRDFNADGVFLATTETIPLNYVMDLCLTLPDGPLEVLAVARFVGRSRHGHGIGVAFHALAADDRKRWLAHYRAALVRMLDELPPDIARHLRSAIAS